MRDYSLVAAKHQLADKSARNAALARPFTHTAITQPMDLSISDSHNLTAFTQRVIDNDTYQVTGTYPAHPDIDRLPPLIPPHLPPHPRHVHLT